MAVLCVGLGVTGWFYFQSDASAQKSAIAGCAGSIITLIPNIRNLIENARFAFMDRGEVPSELEQVTEDAREVRRRRLEAYGPWDPLIYIIGISLVATAFAHQFN